MSNAADAYKTEKRRSGFQGLRGNKTKRSENENACLEPTPSLAGDQERAKHRPALRGPLRDKARETGSWDGPVPPSLHFSESNQLSERRKETDFLAVYLADRKASPTSPQGGSGGQSDVSDVGPN